MGLSLPGAHWVSPWPLLKEPGWRPRQSEPRAAIHRPEHWQIAASASYVLPSTKETSQIGPWELTELTELTASAPPLQEGRSLSGTAVVQLNPRQRRPSERAYRA